VKIHRTKIFKRAKIILLGGLNRISGLLNNLVASYLIIFYTSADFWGGVVYVIIIIDFAFNFVNWGNRPYLIREFSLDPQKISRNWRESLVYRSWLLVVFLVVIAWLPYAWEIKSLLMLWSIGKFIYQSYEAIVQYQRNFTFSLASEAMGLLILVIPILWWRSDLTLYTVVGLYTLSISVRAILNTIRYRAFFASTEPATPSLSPLKFFQSSKAFLIDSFPFLLLTLSGMLQSRTDLYCVAYFSEQTRGSPVSGFYKFPGLLSVGRQPIVKPFCQKYISNEANRP